MRTLPLLLLWLGFAGLSEPATAAQVAAGAQTPGQVAKSDADAGAADTRAAGGAYAEFLAGLRFEAMGQVTEALAAYERAERLDPSSAEIPSALAELYARQDRSGDALKAAERAIKANPRSPEANWVLGRIYAAIAESANPRDPVATDYAARAIPFFERVDPVAHPGVRRGLAELHLRTGNFQKAVSLLVAYLAEEPGDTDAITLLADAYRGLGRTADAIELLEEAAREDPGDPDLQSSLGELYEGRGDWDEAARAYGEAVRRRPSTRVRILWATALLNTGSLDNARQARAVLEDVTARATAPSPWSLYLLAQAQRRMSDLAAAEATGRRILAAEGSGLLGPFVLAQVFEERGEYRKAVEVLQPALAGKSTGAAGTAGIDPARLWTQLGAAHQQLRELPQAVKAFAEALALSPGDPVIHALSVQALLAAGRNAEALAAVGRAKEQFPDDLRFVRLQARALRLDGRFDQAVAVMKAALAARADEPLLYVGLAELYADGNRPEDALAVLRGATSRFPKDPSIRFQLGATLERQRRYADAERVLRQVIADDPQNADALNYLGYMLADRGDRLEESVQFVRRALALDPGNAAFLDSLGWAYYRLNRLDLADGPLQQAAARMQSSSVVQSHLGDLHFKRGRYGEAIAAWERALAGDGEAIARGDIQKKIRDARRKLGRQE